MLMGHTCCWFLTKDKEGKDQHALMRTTCLLLFLTKEQEGKDQHALIRTTCLLLFLTYSTNHKGKQEGFEEQTPPEFRCLSSLRVLHSQSVYSKPHGGFVVFPLFTFCIPNTHIVNRMAVLLFILSLCSTFPIRI